MSDSESVLFISVLPLEIQF